MTLNNSNKSSSYLTENTVSYKTDRLMLYRKQSLFSDPHRTHKYTGQNIKFVNVKHGGTKVTTEL